MTVLRGNKIDSSDPARWIILVILFGMSITGGCIQRKTPGGASMGQAVYVWQREWNDSVKQAIDQAADRVDLFVVLAGEVRWIEGQPQVAKVGVDYVFLKTVTKPVGIAIRIGEYTGRFGQDATSVGFLEALASNVLAEAQGHGLNVAELQVDLDCPESRLEDYSLLIRAIKRTIRPVPLVMTALPCWLSNPHFPDLAQASDGFVLQVHSLARPESPSQEMTLCDPVKALMWVRQAGAFGIPFRVALPTYGYMAAFSDKGQFVAAFAEGPARSWDDKTRVVTIRSDPAAMAALAQAWRRARPPTMQGIIWYRLPVSGDRLNWKWETLSAIVDGKIPIRRMTLRVEYPEPPLAEVVLVNEGQIDTPPEGLINLDWDNARLVGGDGLSGYEFERAGENRASLRYAAGRSAQVIRAGERRKIAWLRFERKTEVKAHVANP